MTYSDCSNKVLVIGGSNIDYLAKSKDKINYKDSNIGDLDIFFGGVARNIVENLARLNVNVTFITAIGDDYLGKLMYKELQDLNVNVIMPEVKDKKSGCYLAIHNNDGDMELGICNQDIMDLIDIEFIKKYDELIKSFDYILIDANSNKCLIDYMLETYKDKYILFDAISIKKALKVKDSLDNLSLIKCNLFEANSILGYNEIKYDADIAIKEMVSKYKTKNIIITNGKKDTYYSHNGIIDYVKVNPMDDKDIVNTTGVGDAMLSGIIYGLLHNFDIEKSIKIGMKVSNITLLSKGANNKKLNEDMIK